MFARCGAGLSLSGSRSDQPDAALSHVVVAVRNFGANFLARRTRAKHDRSPDQVPHGFGDEVTSPVSLSPLHRPRVALRLNAGRLAEDLVVLLQRQWRG